MMQWSGGQAQVVCPLRVDKEYLWSRILMVLRTEDLMMLKTRKDERRHEYI